MVVMQDILGIPMSDILYMSAKNSSAGQQGQVDRKNNRRIIANRGLSREPPEIQGLVNDTRWLAVHDWAMRLQKAASAKLDANIERIGQDVFAARLAEYRRLLTIAQAECTDPDPKCYWNDNGCHYDCLDRISGYLPPAGHELALKTEAANEDAANAAGNAVAGDGADQEWPKEDIARVL